MRDPSAEAASRLTPEARALLECYLDRVRGALLVSAAGEAGETVEELREHVLEEMAGGAGTDGELTRILDGLGSPEALAAEYAGDARPESDGSCADAPEQDRTRLAGTVLGMPYELRVPTSERIAGRWWNPLDPHIFVPRIFGVGWDINFGAVAVRLGIVRPDDEDEPFARVPEGWLFAAGMVPVAIAATVVVLVAAYWTELPASLPAQWGTDGVPTQLWPKAGWTTFVLVMSVVPALASLWTQLRRRRPLYRGARAALASMLATIALAQTVQTLVTLAGSRAMWPTWVGLALALVLPFVMLVTLSRIGRAAEQRRDLAGPTGEERV